MNYLITGANGFVGKYFIEYLQKQEPDAVIYGADIMAGAIGGVCCRQIDLTDRDAVYSLLEEIKPDYLVHLAAMSSVAQSWKAPAQCFTNNTSVFLNLADATRELNLQCRILSVGSSEEYGIYNEPIIEAFLLHPKNPYSVARVCQEYLSKLYVDNFGMDIVMTRSFNHIGPRQNQKFVIPSFVQQLVKIAKGEQADMSVGNLNVIRDFLDVRDVVTAYYKILKYSKTRETYNVCSGKGVKLSEIIDLIAKELHIMPKIVVDENKIRPNEIMSVVGDNSKLKNDLGWFPEYTLSQTLQDMINYEKSGL